MITRSAQSGKWIRTREFYIHDGSKLRRLRVPAYVQLCTALMIGLLVAFSTFSFVRIVSASPATPQHLTTQVSADMARLAAATEVRVLELEHRQQQLAAMMSGEENIDRELLRQIATVPTGAAVGGPYEPVGGGDSDKTFKQLFTSWKKLDTISSGAIAVPSEKPVKSARFESAYGERSDPFTGGRARHMGIDLSGPVGTPIYATADGVVSDAGWNSGGYGNLIKLDHGRGVETRYAHLSSIVVRAGQTIKRGQMIGKMGSTGRSTGSHLHYEVRISGKAVNPIPFMKSTDYLLAMQKGGGTKSMDNHVAQGGPTGSKR
jgi:murein DD-endopeptidase MepM/ murein hydrolase activator NlpD